MVIRALFRALQSRAQRAPGLVPGRECGPCTACCTHLKIDTPDLQKFGGVDCEHLLPQGGCGIYEQRPAGCRDFHCAWRQLPALPEDWRPDLSGVLLVGTNEGIPPTYAATVGLKIFFIKSPPPVGHPSVVQSILAFVNAGIPMFMCINGPPGRVAKTTLLNEGLRRAIADHGPGAAPVHLANVLEALDREPKEALVLKHYGTVSH